VDLSGTSHVSYPVIKTLTLAERKGSYTPSPHGRSTVAQTGHQQTVQEDENFGIQYAFGKVKY